MVGPERSRDRLWSEGSVSEAALVFCISLQSICASRVSVTQGILTPDRSCFLPLLHLNAFRLMGAVYNSICNFSFKCSSLPSFLSNRSTWFGQVASWHTILSRGNWRSLLLTDALPLATWMAWRSRRLWIFSSEGAFRVQAPVQVRLGLRLVFPPSEEEWSVLWPGSRVNEQSYFCLFVCLCRLFSIFNS